MPSCNYRVVLIIYQFYLGHELSSWTLGVVLLSVSLSVSLALVLDSVAVATFVFSSGKAEVPDMPPPVTDDVRGEL